MSTHYRDAVIPQKNERTLLEKAEELGFHELIFLTDNPSYVPPALPESSVTVTTALLLKNTADLAKHRKRFTYLFAPAERMFFERNVDGILHAELEPRQDSFHYRRTLLDQVHGALAKEHSITILFDYGLIRNERSRSLLLGRAVHNAKLVRKFKLAHATYSFASVPEQMVTPAVLRSFEKTLGL